MNLDTDRLRVLHAVARAGGFSRAAERLHRTQPAVSQAVRTLEEQVGEPLLLRLGRRVELTAAGEILVEQAEQAFAALDVARERLEALRGLETGALAIATSDTNACYLLPPVLRAFRERHPGIELRIANRPSPAAEAQVLDREVDLAIVTLPAGDPRLVAEPLAVREDVVIFAPDHPLAGRRRLRLESLVEHPLLLLDRGARSRSWIDEGLRASGTAPRVAMELASIEVVKRLVALGFGISVVPRIAVDDELAAGRLACARLVGSAGRRRVGVVHPRGSTLARPAAAFLEIARSAL